MCFSILFSRCHLTMPPVILGCLILSFALSSSVAAINTVWLESPNFGRRSSKPTILVMHYTAGGLDSTIAHFINRLANVSSHYTVATNGTIYQHVEERNRAWHAGRGSWRNVNDVNTYSIGIEIVNAGYKEKANQPGGTVVPGSSRQWYPYPSQQMDAVIQLASDIVDRYKIVPRNVIGHSDLAPGRKEDPGPLFPWAQLARNGIGAWVDQNALEENGNVRDVRAVQRKLRQYGYSKVPQNGRLDTVTKDTLKAFHMHFRQSNIAGTIDKKTIALLDALLKKYRS